MIAKLICTGPDRAAALSSLHSALQQLQVCGGVCVVVYVHGMGAGAAAQLTERRLLPASAHESQGWALASCVHPCACFCACVCVSLVCARHVINCVPVLLLLQVSGLPTNIEFLKRITQNEEFKQARGHSTVPPAFLPPPLLQAVAAAVVSLAAAVIPRGEEPPFSSFLALPWAPGKLGFFRYCFI
jgi:hypothetical protein